MCEPTTIAIASMAATAIGGTVSAYSQYAQGEAASDAAKKNASYSDWQAQDALERGEIEETNVRRKYEILKSQQRAAQAANGVVVDQDTSLDIIMDTAGFGELDALTTRSNAQREAHGYRVQGINQRSSGKSAQFAGRTGATSTLLASAGKTAIKFNDANEKYKWFK